MTQRVYKRRFSASINISPTVITKRNAYPNTTEIIYHKVNNLNSTETFFRYYSFTALSLETLLLLNTPTRLNIDLHRLVSC